MTIAPTRSTAGYRRHRTRLIAYGRWNPWTDATPAREHLKTLHDQHHANLRGLAAQTNIAYRTLWDIYSGATRTCRSATARAILAIEPRDQPDSLIRVDPLRTVRQLRALVAIGWTCEQLAPLLVAPGRTGNESYLRRLVRQDRHRRVTARLARMADQLYRQIDGRPPPRPSRFSVNRAAAAGWHTPDIWLDYDIDDPADPRLGPDPDDVDEVAVEQVLRGQADAAILTDAERDAAARLGGRPPYSYSTSRLSRLLGKSAATIAKIQEAQ